MTSESTLPLMSVHSDAAPVSTCNTCPGSAVCYEFPNRPLAHKRIKRLYFAPFAQQDGAVPEVSQKLIAAIVPVYNERPADLKRTLLSLQATVEHANRKRLHVADEQYALKILVVQDGWEKRSRGMESFISAIFGIENCPLRLKVDDALHAIMTQVPLEENGRHMYWTDVLSELQQCSHQVPHSSLVLSGKAYLAAGIKLDVSFLIKVDNRKKHNSHHWFFNSFVEECGADYAFATDCSTVYDTDMMHHLLTKMESNPCFCAVTARQRVMTCAMQQRYKDPQFDDDDDDHNGSNLTNTQALPTEEDDVAEDANFHMVSPQNDEEISLAEKDAAGSASNSESEPCFPLSTKPRPANIGESNSWSLKPLDNESIGDSWLRAVQRFDFESSFESFMGAFSTVGVLPVLPGPCGLYRVSDLITPSQAASKVWTENARASEAIKPREHGVGVTPLDWYFQVVTHTNPKMVLGNLQIAEDRILSYASVLFGHRNDAWQTVVPQARFFFEAETDLSQLAFQRRRWVNGTWAGYAYLLGEGLLWKSNMSLPRKIGATILFGFQLLMFLGVALAPAVFQIAFMYAVRKLLTGDLLEDVIIGANALLYVGFVVAHVRDKFIPWLWYLSIFQNFITMTAVIAVIVKMAISGELSLTPTADDGVVSTGVMLIISGALIVTPMITSLVNTFSDDLPVAHMLAAFIPFLFFQPTLVMTISAYAFARTFDLTWGNRPEAGVTIQPSLPADGEALVHRIAMIQYEGQPDVVKAENKRWLERQRRYNRGDEFKARSLMVCIFLVVTNILILLLANEYNDRNYVVFALSFFCIVFGALQQPLSLVFFCYSRLSRLFYAAWLSYFHWDANRRMRLGTYPLRKEYNPLQ